MSEEYNGWTNRETWALNLWLTSDEGTYNEVVNVLKDAKKNEEPQDTRLKDFVEDFFNSAEFGKPNSIVDNMRKDVGSLWRVNWREIVEAFKEDLEGN